MAGKYWLFKSEPGSYSFDDLVRDGVSEWDGVRNYQVRNWLKNDIEPGDGVLFYHSSTKVIGVVGTATVVRGATRTILRGTRLPTTPTPRAPPTIQSGTWWTLKPGSGSAAR